MLNIFQKSLTTLLVQSSCLQLGLYKETVIQSIMRNGPAVFWENSDLWHYVLYHVWTFPCCIVWRGWWIHVLNWYIVGTWQSRVAMIKCTPSYTLVLSLIIHNYYQTSNVRCAKSPKFNVSRPVLQLSLPNPIHWSQVLSWKWKCSWSIVDRRCSNYVWVINKVIAY